MFEPVDIEHSSWADFEIYVAVFDSVPDPKEAYEGVCLIEIEAKAQRGYARTRFDAKAFRPLG